MMGKKLERTVTKQTSWSHAFPFTTTMILCENSGVLGKWFFLRTN